MMSMYPQKPEDYGELGQRIYKDAEILAALITEGLVSVEDMQKSSEAFKLFVERGGDDTHSGNSFYLVCKAALDLLEDKREIKNPALVFLPISEPSSVGDINWKVSKFKVGDRVICYASFEPHSVRGVIIAIRGNTYDVQTDRHGIIHDINEDSLEIENA